MGPCAGRDRARGRRAGAPRGGAHRGLRRARRPRPRSVAHPRGGRTARADRLALANGPDLPRHGRRPASSVAASRSNTSSSLRPRTGPNSISRSPARGWPATSRFPSTPARGRGPPSPRAAVSRRSGDGRRGRRGRAAAGRTTRRQRPRSPPRSPLGRPTGAMALVRRAHRVASLREARPRFVPRGRGPHRGRNPHRGPADPLLRPSDERPRKLGRRRGRDPREPVRGHHQHGKPLPAPHRGRAGRGGGGRRQGRDPLRSRVARRAVRTVPRQARRARSRCAPRTGTCRACTWVRSAACSRSSAWRPCPGSSPSTCPTCSARAWRTTGSPSGRRSRMDRRRSASSPSPVRAPGSR